VAASSVKSGHTLVNQPPPQSIPPSSSATNPAGIAKDAASLLSALAQTQPTGSLPPNVPQIPQPPKPDPNLPPPNEILSHLLGMMGGQASLQGLPSLNTNPTEFDYDDDDDGLNSKPVSAKM
jgi:hypothetical protein